MSVSDSANATVVIQPRFRGPPRSGNGGYVCGLMAAPLAGPVAARLRAPPPLETPLVLAAAGESVRLEDGPTLVGEARRAPLEIEVPSPPAYAAAVAAAQDFAGDHHHPFPGCFVCGTERAAGDGLRIFPGRLPGTTQVAAPWIPDASLGDAAGVVRREFLWSALDCTGAFAVWPAPGSVAIVLGELCAELVGSVRVGEPCVVLGWPLGKEGRKRFAGSAIFASDARLVARARATWIEVPHSAWQ